MVAYLFNISLEMSINLNKLQMSNIKHLEIYLRKTNGKGEKVFVNQLMPIAMLYELTANLFHTFVSEIYYKGHCIKKQSPATLYNLGIESGSILHIKSQAQATQSCEIRVFYKGSLYSYESKNQTKLYEVKKELQKFGLNGNQEAIMTYLGKIVDENDTVEMLKIRDKDIISMITCADWRSEISFKVDCKIADSMTIAQTEGKEKNKTVVRELLRKSSMKSSQQSREKEKISHGNRPKSESKFEESGLYSYENFDLVKQPWLSNHKVIETQSINCEDSVLEDDPQFWLFCQVSLTNVERTRHYIFNCTQSHTISDVIKKTAKIEQTKESQISLQFPSPKLEIQTFSMTLLEIAKSHAAQSLPEIVFVVSS